MSIHVFYFLDQRGLIAVVLGNAEVSGAANEIACKATKDFRVRSTDRFGDSAD
jgi:hypothetical protein